MSDLRSVDDVQSWEIAVAEYLSQGLNQKEVGDLLEMPHRTVNTTVQKLRRCGVLVSRVCGVSDERLHEARRWRRDDELQRALNEGLRRMKRAAADAPCIRMHVSRLGAGRYPAATLNQAVSRMLALRLLLKSNTDRTIGVSWGTLLSYFVDAVSALREEGAFGQKTFKGFTVFSLYGDITPPDGERELPDNEVFGTTFSAWSSLLALRLSELLQSRVYTFHAPGWIPIDAGDDVPSMQEKRDIVQKSLSYYEGYGRTFEGNGAPPLASNADVLLTGIGSRQSYRALLEATGRFAHPDVRRALRKGRIVGDLSGIPLTANGPLADDVGEMLALSSTGCRAEHLRSVVQRAFARNQPGVCAIATGEENKPAGERYFAKTEAICAVLQADEPLVNELWMDAALALDVGKRLGIL